jgi:hypothetical protein
MMSSGVDDGDGASRVPADAAEFERSAYSHEQQARLHDQWAAETAGWLHFGFLHAAEAQRAAARTARALGAEASRRAYPGHGLLP